MHKTYSPFHRGLNTRGLKTTRWDDCLLQVDYRRAQATAVSYGEQYFTVGLSNGEVILYPVEAGRVHRKFKHDERVRLVTLGPREKLLASSGMKYVRLWDLSTGHQLHVFQTARQTLSLPFSNNAEYLLAATQADVLSCWSLERGVDEEPEEEQISWQNAEEGELSGYMQRQPPTHATFSAERDLLAIAYRGRNSYTALKKPPHR